MKPVPRSGKTSRTALTASLSATLQPSPAAAPDAFDVAGRSNRSSCARCGLPSHTHAGAARHVIGCSRVRNSRRVRSWKPRHAATLVHLLKSPELPAGVGHLLDGGEERLLRAPGCLAALAARRKEDAPAQRLVGCVHKVNARRTQGRARRLSLRVRHVCCLNRACERRKRNLHRHLDRRDQAGGAEERLEARGERLAAHPQRTVQRAGAVLRTRPKVGARI
eukprot:1490888-Pleurochrysis_carterae.AAC.1